MPRGPAAVVLPDRNRRTGRPALRRLRVGLLPLWIPYHDREAEGVRRYSVSSILLPRSCSTKGGNSSIPEHAVPACSAVAAPAATLRYSVSSIPAPLTPHPTGSGELPLLNPQSPREEPRSGDAAEVRPRGSGTRSGPRRDRAASAASRHSHPAAGRAGGAGVPRPRSPASRGVPTDSEPTPNRSRTDPEPPPNRPRTGRGPPASRPPTSRQPPDNLPTTSRQVPNSSRTGPEQVPNRSRTGPRAPGGRE